MRPTRISCALRPHCYTWPDLDLDIAAPSSREKGALGAAGRNSMNDEARGTGGLDRDPDRAPRQRSRWGRRSPYGYPRHDGAQGRTAPARPTYAALDLGTNNCRLLVARPTGDSFRVVDAFSRIIRLGEGVSASGRISDAAISRAVDALGICRDKMAQPRRHPRAADRDRGLPRGRQRRRVPRPHRRRGRARARDHRPRDRGRARRHRLHAAVRSAGRRRDPVRHRRRLLRDRAARALGCRCGAGRRCRRSRPGCRCRSGW